MKEEITIHNDSRSMDFSLNKTIKPDSNSCFFIPNYPINQPIFYIPKIPSIIQVPEIKPQKNPPPPGYDMKTLRKQVEFLIRVRLL